MSAIVIDESRDIVEIGTWLINWTLAQFASSNVSAIADPVERMLDFLFWVI
jgi:hypothetical protein